MPKPFTHERGEKVYHPEPTMESGHTAKLEGLLAEFGVTAFEPKAVRMLIELQYERTRRLLEAAKRAARERLGKDGALFAVTHDDLEVALASQPKPELRDVAKEAQAVNANADFFTTPLVSDGLAPRSMWKVLPTATGASSPELSTATATAPASDDAAAAAVEEDTNGQFVARARGVKRPSAPNVFEQQHVKKR